MPSKKPKSGTKHRTTYTRQEHPQTSTGSSGSRQPSSSSKGEQHSTSANARPLSKGAQKFQPQEEPHTVRTNTPTLSEDHFPPLFPPSLASTIRIPRQGHKRDSSTNVIEETNPESRGTRVETGHQTRARTHQSPRAAHDSTKRTRHGMSGSRRPSDDRASTHHSPGRRSHSTRTQSSSHDRSPPYDDPRETRVILPHSTSTQVTQVAHDTGSTDVITTKINPATKVTLVPGRTHGGAKLLLSYDSPM